MLSFFRNFFRNTVEISEKFNLCIFGLGNPGSEYHSTRHNAGFRVLDSFNSSLTEQKRRCTGTSELLSGRLENGTRILSVKPLTFMNRSGEAVTEVLKLYGHSEMKHIVVVDDFNIPLGTLRFRRNGSHGGHNGLKSIINSIGSDFPRLRIGIGPLPPGISVIDFVLGSFSQEEETVLSSVLPVSCKALRCFITESIDTVMNKYN